mmetsp:Transcript_1969/g.2795  ORF Transcript_1969/g.2795 Transcript_1969/m.2795 type:complete len:82 (+) Transcript_1969:968-1213(+)
MSLLMAKRVDIRKVHEVWPYAEYVVHKTLFVREAIGDSSIETVSPDRWNHNGVKNNSIHEISIFSMLHELRVEVLSDSIEP